MSDMAVANSPAMAKEQMSAPASAAVSAGVSVAGESDKKQAVVPRKIISTGTVDLVCEDLDRASEGIEAQIKRFGGFIGDANQTGSRGDARTASWTIRVPADRFDALMKALPRLGELQSSSREAQDLGEEFYDAEARVKNKRVEEVRLVELLKRVAGNLDQILRVETELSRIRGEIESIEGRLRYLSRQTDLSTITVTMREVKNFVPEGPPTLGSRVGRTFAGSRTALAEFGTALLLLFVALSPWLLIVGGVAFVVHRVVKWKRRPRKVARPDEPGDRV